MDELKFKVSSGLKNILGRDLITSDNIAILELVKNSYDAHATKVDITFKADSITIADNGKGMSLSDIQQKWLFVGYSAKKMTQKMYNHIEIILEETMLVQKV